MDRARSGLKSGKSRATSGRPATKSSRGKSARKRVNAEPFVSKYPPIDFDALKVIPEIKLTIRLSSFKAENSVFELKVPVSYTLHRVKELINLKHNNSCKNIRMYVNIVDPANSLDKVIYKTFKELQLEKEIVLYYEYDAVQHPLLCAGLI